MHVLRVISSMEKSDGGPAEGIRNALPALIKLGMTSEVVCLDDEQVNDTGEKVFPIHRLGKGRSPWYYNKRLEDWLIKNAIRFDAVIVHGLWLYHGYAVNKILRKKKKRNEIAAPPYYVMPHGMLDPWFQRAKGRKGKAIRNKWYWTFIEQNIIGDAAALLFTSEEEMVQAATTFQPYRPKQVLNIGYGISLPPVYTTSLEKRFREYISGLNEEPFILFLGRINEKKGLDMLVKAFREVNRENKDCPALVIAGPGGTTAFGKKTIALAAASPKIFFTGFLQDDLKWGAFHSCSAFVLPSHQENFGIAVAEALACGKPVLISDKVNTWKEVAATGAGFVENDSEEGVRELLNKWIHCPQWEKEKMAIQARKCYRQYFTADAAAVRFLEALGKPEMK